MGGPSWILRTRRDVQSLEVLQRRWQSVLSQHDVVAFSSLFRLQVQCRGRSHRRYRMNDAIRSLVDNFAER